MSATDGDLAETIGGALLLVIAPALSVAQTPAVGNQNGSGRPRNELSGERQAERTQREEGDAILGLADSALAGKPTPSDFVVQWQNDFVKAQRGTFVPFTLSVDVSDLRQRSALVYVRAVTALQRPVGTTRSRRGARKRTPLTRFFRWICRLVQRHESAADFPSSRVD